MPKDNETVTVDLLRELVTRVGRIEEGMGTQFASVHDEFASVRAEFASVRAEFASVYTEFARVHREIANLRDDVVDVLDRSIVPQLEDHRRDIALLKRVVVPA